MPKGVKKQKKTKANKKFQKKLLGKSGGNEMTEVDETPKVEEPTEDSGSHQILKRQCAEWKAMKAEVSLLKGQRKKLPKKGDKDGKKALSKEIKKLMAELTEKHVQERRAAGIDKASHKDRDMIAEMEAGD